MPFEIQNSNNIIKVILSRGAMITPLLMKFLLKASVAADNGKELKIFFDFRGCKIPLDLGFNEVWGISNYSLYFRKQSLMEKAAFLVDNNAIFGICRMYQILTQDHPVEIGIFKSEEHANKWIIC